MVIYTRNEAQEQIHDNFELAAKLNMTVINVFRKDEITGEIHLTDMFSHDTIEAVTWKNNYIASLKKLDVPYIVYVGNYFAEAHGCLEFKDDKPIK